MLEQTVPEGPHLVGRTLPANLVKNCLPWAGPHAGAGAECEESSPEEEGVAETTCDELTTTHIPHPPAPLGGRRDRKIWSKVKHGKKRGEGVFKIWFHFSLSCSDLIGETNFPKLSLFCLSRSLIGE